MNTKFSKTIFCDIDGTLIKHSSPIESSKPNFKAEILPGVLEKLKDWSLKNYKLILTTGRRESQRQVTEKQLSELGITYDILIMGIGRGSRVVINDRKPDGTLTAESYCLDRDCGLESLDI